MAPVFWAVTSRYARRKPSARKPAQGLRQQAGPQSLRTMQRRDSQVLDGAVSLPVAQTLNRAAVLGQRRGPAADTPTTRWRRARTCRAARSLPSTGDTLLARPGTETRSRRSRHRNCGTWPRHDCSSKDGVPRQDTVVRRQRRAREQRTRKGILEAVTLEVRNTHDATQKAEKATIHTVTRRLEFIGPIHPIGGGLV